MKNNTQNYDKEILIKIRKSLNLSQTQLARDINKSKQYISAIETGRYKLTKKLLDKIYERYQINPNSFQDGNDLIFQESTPLSDVLKSKYNLESDTANVFSDYLSSFMHLTKEEQQYAKDTLKLMTRINKYIKNK